MPSPPTSLRHAPASGYADRGADATSRCRSGCRGSARRRRSENSPMSTSTTTSRKSCGTSESASTTSFCDSRSTTRSSSRLRRPARLELVVEEVVAFLERLRVGRALLPAAAVDVEVRQDPQQPGAQVRPGRELTASCGTRARRSPASDPRPPRASRRAAARPGRPGPRARAPPLRSGHGRAPPSRSVRVPRGSSVSLSLIRGHPSNGVTNSETCCAAAYSAPDG